MEEPTVSKTQDSVKAAATVVRYNANGDIQSVLNYALMTMEDYARDLKDFDSLKADGIVVKIFKLTLTIEEL